MSAEQRKAKLEKARRFRRVFGRQKAGRRAPVVNGVFIGTATDVPRTVSRECKFCGRRTVGKDAAGNVKDMCHECDRPEGGRLPKWKVWRLCIKCDRKVQRSPKTPGPFFCCLCRKELGLTPKGRTAAAINHGQRKTVFDLLREARVEQLTAVYTGWKRLYPTEGEARRAGVPTRSEDVPWPERIEVSHAAVPDDPVEGVEGEEVP